MTEFMEVSMRYNDFVVLLTPAAMPAEGLTAMDVIPSFSGILPAVWISYAYAKEARKTEPIIK
jgi:hypothetical protein